MATTDRILTLRPRDALPESAGNAVGNGSQLLANNPLVTVGLGAGVGFNKLTDSGVVWVERLPTTASFATGITFALMVADDPLNSDPGKVARFAMTVKKLASGTDVLSVSGAGTETAANLTLPTTAGIVLTGSIAIVAANIDGAAAGDWVLIRCRRLGTNAADTHRGRVVLLGIDVRDT